MTGRGRIEMVASIRTRIESSDELVHVSTVANM